MFMHYLLHSLFCIIYCYMAKWQCPEPSFRFSHILYRFSYRKFHMKSLRQDIRNEWYEVRLLLQKLELEDLKPIGLQDELFEMFNKLALIIAGLSAQVSNCSNKSWNSMRQKPDSVHVFLNANVIANALTNILNDKEAVWHSRQNTLRTGRLDFNSRHGQ